VVLPGERAAAPPAAITPGSRAGSADGALPPPGLSFDPPSVDLFATDPLQQAHTLTTVAELVAECRKCRLCESRAHTVPGEGPADARLVVIGEGPGRTEDATGRPFVGQAGDLLTKILAAIDLPRERVYICNVVKCRPPENRNPEPDEIAACEPFLVKQLDLIKPRIIVALGTFAAQTLLKSKTPISRLRGVWHTYQGIKLMPTLHPAYLLRNPNDKRLVWQDIQAVLREMGRL
jgi:uracil-DNA glycosylase family 4